MLRLSVDRSVRSDVGFEIRSRIVVKRVSLIVWNGGDVASEGIYP
jgi:hypothetical protein